MRRQSGRRKSGVGLILGAAVVILGAISGTAPALAWSAPNVGPACSGLNGAGPKITRVAGNFLGGRQVGRGPLGSSPVDFKSFQNCFASVNACQTWVDAKARAFPLRPGFGRCTPVIVR